MRGHTDEKLIHMKEQEKQGASSVNSTGKEQHSAGKRIIHFGTANDSAEDQYYLALGNVPTPRHEAELSASGNTASLATTDAAFTASFAAAVERTRHDIGAAVTSKNTLRASLGMSQLRPEYLERHLQVQHDNAMAAESRMADVDVALEMTEFVRNHILSQSAVAKLSQASVLPQMALTLVGR